jgi:hypothetical protein
MDVRTSRNGGSRLALAGALLSFFLAPAAQAECIVVTASDYQAGSADMGVTPVEWLAELSNECPASYDADLEIAFVDEGGNTIYKVSELVTVPRHGNTTAQREIYIPAPDFERIHDLQVKILAERERPF